MVLQQAGHAPTIHPTAYVAPTATVCGAAAIGPHSRVMFGASLVAEGGPLDFPLTADGLDRKDATMPRIAERMAALLANHRADTALA